MAPPVTATNVLSLEEHGARMFGVFEKGGAWAPITGDGMGEVTVDEGVGFGTDAVDGIRTLVRERFADTMFFDETKRAMISVEQRTDVDAPTYAEAQGRFQDAAFDVLTALGIGLRYGERSAPDAAREVPFRIDPEGLSSIGDVLEVMELRLAIEVEAAALAAERITPERLMPIGRALRDIEAAIGRGEGAINEDFAFHRAIAEASPPTPVAGSPGRS